MHAPPPPPPGWLSRLAASLRPHWPWVLACLGGAVLAQLVAVAGPLIQRHVIDQVLVPRRGDLRPWIALLLLAGLLRFGCSVLYRYASGLVSLRVQYDLRTAIFAHLQRLDFARHDEI